MASQPLHSPSERETIRASILKSRLHLWHLQCDLHDTVLKSAETITQSLEVIATADKALVRRQASYQVHKYRLYVYDAEGRLIAPAMVISADNDDAATEQAENMLDGARAELWDGERLVVRLPDEQ